MPESSAESHYFATNPPPKQLQQHLSLAKAFIAQHSARGKRVVLVTSGGTTVPLENQTVRYIDNFSAGTRGATSAEYFLNEGYAVIFLHRQFSLLPYSRHYSHNTRSFLDYMVEVSGSQSAGPRGGEKQGLGSGDVEAKMAVGPEHQESMIRVFRQYARAKRENSLLILSFVTITEYLWELREVAKLMQPLGSSALFYLAAAVSDFFVPAERMVEHKIQSNEEFSARNPAQLSPRSSASSALSAAAADGAAREDARPAARTDGNSLIIDLSPVPKFLKSLVDSWAPSAMIVSFKLETDPSLLVAKARHALRTYQHHLVIGNLLNTRKWEVVFVSAVDAAAVATPDELRDQVSWIRVPRGRRTMSYSGIERLVGRAAVVARGGDVVEEDEEEGQDGPAPEEHRFVGEPPVEIESLIVPAIRALHDRVIEKVGRHGENGQS